MSEQLTIDQILRRQAAQTPNAVAIAATGGKRLTYRELIDQVDYVAHFLAKSGLSQKDCVAIVLPNGPEMAIAFLGVSSVAISAPLNPGYREDEFDFYLSELNVRALIVQSGSDSPAIPVARRRNIAVIDLSPLVGAAAGLFHLRADQVKGSSVVHRAEPTDVALILHTSGTTSRSKMVPLTHSNLLASARNITTRLGLTSDDRCLNVMPLFHIHGLIGAVLSSLMAGGSVVCTSGFDPEAFFLWLKEFYPTWYTAVPAMHQAVLSCAQANGNLRAGHSLRFIRSSSAALAPGVMRELEAVFGVPIIEAYGMTEAAHQIASNPLPPRERKAGSVGLPEGCEVSIMDEGGNLLSPGKIGEIVIRGPNVMSRYANNLEANTESFASGWFRTGDQGYLDADGYVFITGRLKEMINRGGEKVSPREVDEVLLEHPAVAEAVSFAVPHVTLGEDVAAAVVLREKKSVTESELQRFAAVRIADFKIPRRVLIVNEIPKGPTGKVQRAGLAERFGLTAFDRAQTDVDIEYTAPRNPIEQKLAEIWARVLGIKRAGIHDNLFHLGGDSIHAARIISRMRESMGIEFPFGVFFEAPTVAAIASLIETSGTQVQSRRLSPAEKQETGTLSHGQEALWFLDQLDPGNPAYNRPVFARLQGNLNVSVLERCLNELVHRHAVLRASFPAAGDKPIQLIGAHQPLSLPVTDIAHLAEFEREAQAAKAATEEARRPFDLARGPLFRASLLRLTEQSHVLLVTTQHIVFDGWSAEIFLRELAMLYEAVSNNRPSPLPELPVQYSDFVRWQRETMEDEPLKNQLAYWRRQLDGSWPILSMPTDRPRPSIRTSNGASRSFALANGLSEKLNEISRQERVSLFMTLLATFKTLLYRYSEQEDIIVGAPFAGRNQVSTENLVGLFINTLPLRTDLSGDPTFRELLARVRRTCLEAQANQDIPFERIVSELQLKRDTSRPGIYQVLFQLRNYPRQLADAGDLVIKEYKADSGRSICDISLAISEEKNGLECCFEYCTDLFDTVTIDRMWRHFQSLLQNIAANPDKRLSAFPLLTEAERQQLLVEWNDTKRDYPSDKCIPRLFEAQVERTPDAVAVVFEDKRLTYRELNKRANQLAHYLRKLGVVPEVLVGLCMERSLEMVVGLLGILKSGGAYVPLDPEYPKARLAYMLAQTQFKFLLTQERLLETLPEFKGRAVCLDRDNGFFEAEQKQNPNIHIEPDQLAYVIYTSGSTGKPKGVLNCHRGVVNYFSYLHETYNLNDTDTVLQIPSLSFDPSVRDLIGPLTAGAQVVIVNDFDAKDPAALLGKIREHRVTCILSIVPTLLNGLLEAARDEDLRYGSTRVVLVSGEALTTDSCQRARELFGETTWLVNQYGPTESTLTCTYHRILETDHRRGIAPLGRPIGNARVYILDDHLRLVPIGIPGELHVGGVGLARGYVNSPELTAERFIPHPFSDDPGARLYKTGDLGRYTPDGGIEFLGRIDHQVKIRGFRIELGEIEAVLTEHPGVQQALAVVPEDPMRSDRLIAYVVPNDRQALRKDDLRNFLKSRLPEYMVPSAFVSLDEFPLTPNRKIDRRALPAPDPTESELGKTFVLPRTPVEEVLAAVWNEVLGVQQIGIHDNFFDLGGHSLLAAKAVARIRKAFHIELPLREMFDSGSVAELAKSVETAFKKAGGLQVPAPRPTSRNEVLPLSFGQERLWFLNQLEPGNPAYTIFTAWRINGLLDCDQLKRIIEEIVRRHEILRTTFPSVDGDGVPIQAIAPSVAVELPVIDLSELPEVDREAEALRLAGFEAQRNFDLSVGPLLRTTLLKISRDEHLLLLSMHHIISDGWSMGIFYREVASSYEAFSRGRPPQLPDVPIQYVDFAIWQRKWLQGGFLDSQLSYWKQHLNGSPPLLELPADHPRPAIQTFRGAAESFKLSRTLSDQLKTFSLKQGVTLFMTLLAAFKTLLSRYTGQHDIIVGSPTAGRNLVETEVTIGFFVNVLLFRIDMSGDPTFQELLRRTREEALAAYAHPEVPFERLIEELKLKRTLSYHSLFQVMFVLHNDYMSSFQPSGLRFTRVTVSSSASKFDLTLGMRETKEGLEGRLIYSTDLFDARTIKRMAGHFDKLLQAIVTNPEQCLSELPLLTEAERRQLLVDWNDTTRDYPKNKCIHELFEAQVTQTPEAIAVVFEDRQMTYRQLNNAANRLALQLLRRGVGKGCYVPTLMERSIEVVISMLSVMKVGAAFVPLDLCWPTARLKQVLEDLSSEVILVNKTNPFNGQELGRAFLVVNEPEGSESMQNPDVRVDPEQPIYAIYTSGSTGRPKAAVVPHRGISNRFLWMNEFFGKESAVTVLQTTPHIYDSAVWQLFWPLINGGKTIIPSPGTEILADYLSALIERHTVTMTDFVPSVFNTIVPQMVIDGEIRKKLRSLLSLVVGGEEITPSTTYTFMAHFPHIRVINLYGPTEASIGCICYEVTGKEGGLIPIGKPIANVHVLILDRKMNPVPIGVPGELYLSGICLGLGYLNDEEKTKAAFVDNPFPEIGYPKLYKTGDLARYLPEGNIEFLGRIDHQVKIRGLRIEPGEIESVVARHPTVQQAIVVAWVDASGERRLVAYVVPHSGQSVTTGELRSFLIAKLPSYMVPSTFVLLESLPLTPNGKVDRKALPAPDQSRSDLEASYVAPRSPVEEMLVGIWAEVLKLERIGVHDHFFDLGGHSLLAAQAMSRICQALQVELPLRALFETPTVAELGKRVEEAQGEDQRLSTRPIVPVCRDKDLPLSFSQQRLWFLDQYEPNSSAYNIRSSLRVRGSLDVAALEQSLNEIVRRHESLRTTFLTVDGQPVQMIAPSVGLSLPVVDLKGHPEGEREEEARRLVREEAGQPFNLEQGPLFRSKLLRLDEDDHVLLLTLHHIVADGWSMGVLRRELSVLYEAFCDGKSSPLSDLPIQYADFAIWQREWLQGEVLESQISYWKKQLEGIPAVLRLPMDRPRPAVQNYRGARLSFVLSKDLTEQLKALSRKEGVTLYMTLLATFKALLYQYAGQTDLVIGSPIAGRNRPEIEGLIGFFVNTLVLRTDLAGNPSFRELLKRVREVCLAAYAHQELPFQKLVEVLHPKRNTSRGSLVRVFFAFQNVPRQPLNIPGLTVTRVRTDLGSEKTALTLFMWEAEECLAGSLNYGADLFDAATISRMMEHFQTLLTAVVADPERRLLDLPLFLEQSRSELLEAIHWATEQSSHFEADVTAGREQGEL